MFYRMSFNLILPDASHEQIQIMHLWQEYQRSDAMFLPLYPIRQHRILICPITEDTHSDSLIKMLSARLLHYKVTLFPFIIILWGGTWKLCKLNIKLLIYSFTYNHLLFHLLYHVLFQYGLMISHFIQWVT